jgi:hypothetical protein
MHTAASHSVLQYLYILISTHLFGKLGTDETFATTDATVKLTSPLFRHDGSRHAMILMKVLTQPVEDSEYEEGGSLLVEVKGKVLIMRLPASIVAHLDLIRSSIIADNRANWGSPVLSHDLSSAHPPSIAVAQFPLRYLFFITGFTYLPYYSTPYCLTIFTCKLDYRRAVACRPLEYSLSL